MFKPLKSILKGSFSLSTNSWKTKLLTQWPAIVGNLNDKITLEKIQEDTLIIGVYETSWLQELYMLSSVLIKTINSHLDKPYIKRIRLKYATKKSTPSVIAKKKNVAPVKRKKITLNSLESGALLKIKDQDMRDALHLFLSRCKSTK